MDFDPTHGLLRFVLAFALVIGLIMLLAAALKKWGGGQASLGRGRDKRLSVLEVTPLDPRRRLVLIRRDDQEHLLLIGGANDVVIETGIAASADLPTDPGRPLLRAERLILQGDGPDAGPTRREPTLGGGI